MESADDGVTTAQRLFQVVGEDRSKAIQHKSATVNSLRLFELLPQHPVVTLTRAGELLTATKPTTQKAIDSFAHPKCFTKSRAEDGTESTPGSRTSMCPILKRCRFLDDALA